MSSWKCYGGTECHNVRPKGTLSTSGYCICETQHHNVDVIIATRIRSIVKKSDGHVSRFALARIVEQAEEEVTR